MKMGCGTSARLKAVLLAGAMGALVLIPSPIPAAESAVLDGSASDSLRELVLRPEVVPYVLENTGCNLDRTRAPFLKEPQLSLHHVFRGLLSFGKDTNNAIALIWDQPRHKLYLDLNRNLDLTDDPAGVFTSLNTELQQGFAQVTLPLKMATGFRSAVLDLQLGTDARGGWATVQLYSRSLWQAKVTVAGEEWQVAAVDSLLGTDGPITAKFLLLRPWASRATPVSWRDAASGMVPFPTQLFWMGRAYRLERSIDASGETAVCKLEFTPQQPPLTELKLSAESLHYTVMRDPKGYTVVMQNPAGAVKVPQGVYTVSVVGLKKGTAEADRLGGEPLVINAMTATNLLLGGPLTNAVTLSRQGRKLAMSYQLVGADGGAYRLAREDRAKPPEFTVYRGGKKVHSGRFEFG